MKITSRRRMSVSKEELWSRMSDFANICNYHPSIKDSYIIGVPNAQGVGATRQCDFAKGKYLQEKVTAWNDGEFYESEIVDSTLSPLKAATQKVGVRQIRENCVEGFIEVDMSSEYLIMKPLMYLFFKFWASPKILKKMEKEILKARSEAQNLQSYSCT